MRATRRAASRVLRIQGPAKPSIIVDDVVQSVLHASRCTRGASAEQIGRQNGDSPTPLLSFSCVHVAGGVNRRVYRPPVMHST